MLDAGEWSDSCPGRFNPQYPLDRMLGGSQSLSERGAQNTTPVVSPYTKEKIYEVLEGFL